MNLPKEAMDWLDRRLGVRELIHSNMGGYLLPRNINIWYTLGAVLMAMFGLQFLTGIVLLVYYVPDTEKAFASASPIPEEAPVIQTVLPSNMFFASTRQLFRHGT